MESINQKEKEFIDMFKKESKMDVRIFDYEIPKKSIIPDASRTSMVNLLWHVIDKYNREYNELYHRAIEAILLKLEKKDGQLILDLLYDCIGKCISSIENYDKVEMDMNPYKGNKIANVIFRWGLRRLDAQTDKYEKKKFKIKMEGNNLNQLFKLAEFLDLCLRQDFKYSEPPLKTSNSYP